MKKTKKTKKEVLEFTFKGVLKLAIFLDSEMSEMDKKRGIVEINKINIYEYASLECLESFLQDEKANENFEECQVIQTYIDKEKGVSECKQKQ